MSYILDALKKLEHEKTRKSRRDGMIGISGTLFESERLRPSGPAGWKIATAVVVAVLVTFTATWLFLQSGKVRGNPSAPLATPPPPAAPVKVEAPPAMPVSAAVPAQQIPSPASSVPAQAASPSQPVPPSKPQTAVVQAVPAAEVADDEQESPRRKRERMRQPAPAAQTTAAPADIKLSGIAWQEERRARRAVVNGFLMQEGGVVSGARISDIFQDRVRFSQSGKTFEIPLISSGGPAEAK